MKHFVSTFFLALISLNTTAIASDDPGGWNNLQWGISADAAIKAGQNGGLELRYGTTTEMRNNSRSGSPPIELMLVQDKLIDIGEGQFKLICLFDENQKLKEVELSSKSNTSKRLYGSIQTALSAKYGTPSAKETDRSQFGTIDKTRWIYPTTNIELKAFSTLNTVEIRYQSLENSGFDAL